MIKPDVVRLIESKLIPLLRTGKDINRISLKVCPDSDIAQLPAIETRFGLLLIQPGPYIPKGYSFLIEIPPTRGGISFNWVSKKKSSRASDGDRQPAS